MSVLPRLRITLPAEHPDQRMDARCSQRVGRRQSLRGEYATLGASPASRDAFPEWPVRYSINSSNRPCELKILLRQAFQTTLKSMEVIPCGSVICSQVAVFEGTNSRIQMRKHTFQCIIEAIMRHCLGPLSIKHTLAEDHPIFDLDVVDTCLVDGSL